MVRNSRWRKPPGSIGRSSAVRERQTPPCQVGLGVCNHLDVKVVTIMRVLLTNDDGISAPGMAALYHAAADLGVCTVIAPAQVRSAASHAVTFHKPIPVGSRTIPDAAGQPLFTGLAVDGNPADCVKLAVTELLAEPVDLVLSGINSGANVGVNVIYSGTIAAAREAAILGLPAIAVSLHVGAKSKIDWPRTSAITRTILQRILALKLEPATLLSVNIPILDDGKEPRGLRVLPVSTSALNDAYECSDGPQGDRHYQASAGFSFQRQDQDTDVAALFAGYVTVSPLLFDPTDAPGVKMWSRRLAE